MLVALLSNLLFSDAERYRESNDMLYMLPIVPERDTFACVAAT